ncbi:MAG: class I SAM-dependent methyltransferase [Actinomycetes bacterium]
MSEREEHWQGIYQTRDTREVSWFQEEPSVSLRLIESVADSSASVVDIGGGASFLVDALAARGFADLTVVDLSQRALDVVGERLAARGVSAALVASDVTTWRPARTFDVWHDRAAFHFMNETNLRERYVELAADSVAIGGALIIATFAVDGPTHCSGIEVARYDAPELAAVFAPHFVAVHDEREEHVTPSGAVQLFTWVVLQRV